jgi:hypothetical protein
MWSPGFDERFCARCRARLICAIHGHVGSYCVVCHFAFNGLRHCRAVKYYYASDLIKVAEERAVDETFAAAREAFHGAESHNMRGNMGWLPIQKWCFRTLLGISTVDLGVCPSCWRAWIRMFREEMKDRPDLRSKAEMFG